MRVFLNSFKNVCGTSTWVYYYFSGENRLQNLAVSLSNLIKHLFLLCACFLYELLMIFDDNQNHSFYLLCLAVKFLGLIIWLFEINQ